MVVAVDKYRTAPLRGCVADGYAMVDFAMENLHVPASQIVTLFDEAASREAILSTFREHFIENKAIAKGDGIVFFYAGHGTQEYAPKDWGLDEDKVECICPQDINWDTVHGIPSTTLNALFRELAHLKGDNIVSFRAYTRRPDGIANATIETAIFDCCHSGQITRIDKGLRYMYPPPDLGPTIPSSLDASVHQWWPDHYGHPRTAKSVLPAGFRYDTMRSHVLLSACRAEEEAMERAIGKDRTMRGWFTSTLLEILAEHEGSTAGLTYAYLFDVLLASKAHSSQHPQCLGKHKNRLMWNTRIKIQDGFPVTVSDGCITVHAGRVHGIARRTTFMVQGRDDSDRRLGTLIVVDLQDLRCVCKCEDTVFDVTTGSRAVVKNWNNEDLSLDLYLDPRLTGTHTKHDQAAIPVSLADRIRLVDEPGKADLAIIITQADPNITVVKRHDPLMAQFAPEIAVDLHQHHIHDLISAALHFNFHLYRRQISLYDPLSAVRLEMYKMEQVTEGQVRYQEADTTNLLDRKYDVKAYKTPGHQVVQGATATDLRRLYGLKIVNDTGFNLFPYLFYFEPSDYRIDVSQVISSMLCAL